MQGQQTFDVDKSKLLEILRANRETHVKEFTEASAPPRHPLQQSGLLQSNERLIWRASFWEALYSFLDGAELIGGTHTVPSSGLEKPRSYEEQYSNVIGILELTNETTVNISWSDYKSYVKDEWSWKEKFTSSNSMYVGAKRPF